ncbi:hypothetical protein [Microvirga sp. TS319]|uniref:hypothetical protein n=1 Tax=Microvirga sp. TS319 TaxID=3241165 RepID=UPI00351A103A
MPEGLSIQTIETLSQGALPEVREFITRKLGCSHWEEADKRRLLKTAEVKRALRHLRCSDLSGDEAFLRKTYAGHAASINALDAAQGNQGSGPGAAAPARRSAPAMGF